MFIGSTNQKTGSVRCKSSLYLSNFQDTINQEAKLNDFIESCVEIGVSRCEQPNAPMSVECFNQRHLR